MLSRETMHQCSTMTNSFVVKWALIKRESPPT